VSSNRAQNRIYLDTIVGEQAAEAAQLLREAGVEVSRNSQARWFVNRSDPRVVSWLAFVADERQATARETPR
jgi:hypothetical protein